MSNPEQLILFDIDGTLIDAAGAGGTAFGDTFETALGWKQDLSHVSFAGATDLRILRQLIRERGIEPTPELEAKYFEQLPKELDRALTKCPPIVLPGVRELLEALSAIKEYKLGIVTGNIEATAWVKLKHAGLRDFFTFGGFGCDDPDRVVICRHAMERGGRSNGVLFGDTPNDVNAALNNNLTSIAVATKHFTVADLKAAGAHHAFPDLTDTPAILKIIAAPN